MKHQTNHSNFIKRVAALAIVMTTIIMVVPFGSFAEVSAAQSITSAASTSGSAYTSSAALAAKLDKIFAGDVGLSKSSSFKTTVKAPLGSSPMTRSRQYYIKCGNGAVTTGRQCFAYANAVYSTLFNEYVGRAGSLSHSKVVISGGNNVSYSQFQKAGVKCGAYVRTTSNSKGTYNGSNGHSFIVLSYNANKITYLEGNADGHGLVKITTRDWKDFNKNQLTRKSRYICHVVQATEKYYNSLYSPSSGSGETAKTTASTTVNANGKVSFSRELSYKNNTMTGSDVSFVQTALKTLGYNVTVNSKYDAKTLTAVKNFQKAHDLKVDGKVNAEVWKALEKAVEEKTSVKSTTASAKATTTAVKSNTASTTVASTTVTTTTTAAKAAALKITTQPKNTSGKRGTKVTFTVKASGEGLKYQWQYSDNNGKTWKNSTLKATTSYTTTAKYYSGTTKRQVRCVVTDASGSKVTSKAATLSVK